MNIKPKERTTRSHEKDALLELRRLYPPHSYLILSQVPIPSENGSQSRRTVDAVAIGLYKSRDLSIHGLEIKSSRLDWLAELANPRKADEASRFFDLWSVVSKPDVVLPNEVPKSWGIIQLVGGTPRFERAPSKRDAQPITTEVFINIIEATIAQKVNKDQDVAIDDAYSAGLRDGRSAMERTFEQGLESLNRSIRRIVDEQAQAKAFLRSVGVDMDNGKVDPRSAEILKVIVKEIGRRFPGDLYKDALEVLKLVKQEKLHQTKRSIETMSAQVDAISIQLKKSLEEVSRAADAVQEEFSDRRVQ